MSETEWFVVIHEWEHPRGAFVYDTASGLHTREGAENQLAYCQGMQERGRPGSDGRYFVARVTEAPPDAAHAAPDKSEA